MKALSIKQPWAQLICTPRLDQPTLGIKDIENRTWKTNYRGRIYVHASLKYTHPELQTCLNYEQFDAIPNELQNGFLLGAWPKSAIIGEIDIIDCVQDHPSVWAEMDVWNWVLANPVLYDKPILNVKGSLSFWEFNK